MVLVVVDVDEQIEGCPPTILHLFKLAERRVLLLGFQPLPLILALAYVQWVAIPNSSWCHLFIIYKNTDVLFETVRQFKAVPPALFYKLQISHF
jgi:hypothetical protein